MRSISGKRVCPKCGAEYQGAAPFVLYQCREKARKKLRYTLLLIVFYGYVSEHYSFLIFITFEECSILKYLNIFSISTHWCVEHSNKHMWNIRLVWHKIKSEYVCIQMGKKSCNYIDCMYFKFAYR